jgi:hypothetical protein
MTLSTFAVDKASLYFTKHIHITVLSTGKICIYNGCSKCTGIPVCVASCQKVVLKKVKGANIIQTSLCDL